MGATWNGKNEWSLRSLGSSARKVIGLRRPMTADPSASALPRRGRVELSEWRGVLDALAQLHKIAPPGYGLPVDAGGVTGGALKSSGRDAVAPPSRLAPHASRPVHNGRRL
jgi:hypothetical protein